MGGPAKDWQCEACLDGARCSGATAANMRVLPGWFVVRSMSKATGAEERPKLLRCPGGITSCPGGASVTAVMGALPLTATTAARTCESVTTPGMEEEDFETMRLQQYPQCQCSRGGTGMLCRTCKSASIVGGKDWVEVHGSGLGCRECSIGSTDARNLVAATAFGFLLIVLCAVVGWWHHTRPSLVEERFINEFRGIEESGAALMVNNFFHTKIGSGITKNVFVDVVARKCGGNVARAEAQAVALWTKLDETEVRTEN